jgi:hypothetical protein
MPNYDDVYSGKYAASSDKEFQPPGRRQTVLIHDAERQLVGPEQRPRVVITVVSPTGQLVGKPIALGKTNYERLKAAFGSETNNWLGQTVETYVELTQYSGRPVWGIRLMPVLQQPAPQQPAEPAPQLAVKPAKAKGNNRGKPVPPPAADADPLDDEVPF